MEQPNIQSGLPGIGNVGAGKTPKPVDPSKASGPAFQALLDRIQSQTKQLQESSKTTDDPASLNKAVDLARASLDDALSLGDGLLEAFREAQQQNTNSNTNPTNEKDNQ